MGNEHSIPRPVPRFNRVYYVSEGFRVQCPRCRDLPGLFVKGDISFDGIQDNKYDEIKIVGNEQILNVVKNYIVLTETDGSYSGLQLRFGQAMESGHCCSIYVINRSGHDQEVNGDIIKNGKFATFIL